MMFEGVPNHPDPGRFWQVVAKHRVNIFYTAPTALRALMREGNRWVTPHDRASLRLLGSVGEPIKEPEWKWYFDCVGEGRCPIVDTWWQTETGGILIAPLPAVTPLKPGSATLPFFGVEPVLLDQEGRELTGNPATGYLCIKQAWPGIMRTVYGDQERFPADLLRPVPRLLSDRRRLHPRRRRLLLGSPAASTTCSTSPATASAPPKWKAPSASIRPWRRRRWSAIRTPSRDRASTLT